MKKIISLLIVLTIVISASLLNTSAKIYWYVKMGDVDSDEKVSVMDATEIQRVLALITETSDKIEFIGDVDEDGTLSIIDATYIQRWLAGFTDSINIDKLIDCNIYFHDFYANYDSGAAMAGVPVAFTVNAEAYVKITSYALYINDEFVAQSEDSNSIEYTFSEPCTYRVRMEVNTPLGSVSDRLTYNVVEKYDIDTPVIKGLYITGKYLESVAYSHSGMAVHAEAIGGTAPYEYKFVLTRPKTLKYEADTITNVQDYSTKDYFELECIDYDDVKMDDYPRPIQYLPCTLTVSVKDANGVEVSRTTEISYTDYPIG